MKIVTKNLNMNGDQEETIESLTQKLADSMSAGMDSTSVSE